MCRAAPWFVKAINTEFEGIFQNLHSDFYFYRLSAGIHPDERLEQIAHQQL
jgi:hypothetical protein